MKCLVHLTFDGYVEVSVPEHLTKEQSDALASRVALAKILATTENPDAPEDDACEEYLEVCKNGSEKDWDNSTANIVMGEWKCLEIMPN